MAKLPGKQKEEKLKKSENKAPKEDPRTPELSFEQMKAQGEELKTIQGEETKRQLEEIRKEKEVEALETAQRPDEEGTSDKPQKKIKKKKETEKDDRINLSEISTEVETRKGGVPDHIKKLPENHPLRIRWEKGYQERDDGAWEEAEEADNSAFIKRSIKQGAVYILTLIIFFIVSMVVYNWYWNSVADIKDEIHNTIGSDFRMRNINRVKLLEARAKGSKWLPEIRLIQDQISDIRDKLQEQKRRQK